MISFNYRISPLFTFVNLPETMMGGKSLNKTATAEEVNRQELGGRSGEGTNKRWGMLPLDSFGGML